jgi:hypothetical protein
MLTTQLSTIYIGPTHEFLQTVQQPQKNVKKGGAMHIIYAPIKCCPYLKNHTHILTDFKIAATHIKANLKYYS